jgi:tetratricopeptide (TPR) repeat protein
MLLVEDRLVAARNHIAAGRQDSAGLVLEHVLDINPGHTEALRMLAEIRVVQGRPKDAVTLAAAACRREPEDVAGLALLARTALLAGQSDMVVPAVESGLSIAPHDPDLAMLKATLDMMAGDFAAAERRLAAALSRRPDHAGLLATLAQLYHRTGTAAPALEFAQKALQRDPDSAAIHAQLGLQLAELGDHLLALPHLERAHLLDPADPNVAAGLVQSLLGTGALTEAQRVADRLIAFYPEFLPAWQAWGATMICRGEADAALARLGPVARGHAERVPALLLLAGLYRIAGRPADALRLMEPLVPRLGQLDRDNRQAAERLLRDCCLSTGEFIRLREILQPVDPAATLAESGPEGRMLPIVIEPGLSLLEIVALLRYFPAASDPADIRGAGALADLVALLPGADFSATDVPRDEPGTEVIDAVPLTALMLHGDRGTAPDLIPYLHPSRGARDVWRRSLEPLPRPFVGVIWDEGRPGLLLDDLAPRLRGMEGTLVGLAWDAGRPQLAAWPAIIDAGKHLSGLDDLAAVIVELDGVIGPDGIALHLAGALGKRGALLTQSNAPWYWHAVDGRSTWYPTIEVLQASGLGHWSDRISDLDPAIGGFVRGLRPPGGAA